MNVCPAGAKMGTHSSSFLLQKNKELLCCMLILYEARNELIWSSGESSLQIATEMKPYISIQFTSEGQIMQQQSVSYLCSQWQSSQCVVHVCYVMFLACFAEATETVGVPWHINKEAYVLSWVIVVAYVWVGGMFVEAVGGCVSSVNCGCMLLGSKGGCGYFTSSRCNQVCGKVTCSLYCRIYVRARGCD